MQLLGSFGSLRVVTGAQFPSAFGVAGEQFAQVHDISTSTPSQFVYFTEHAVAFATNTGTINTNAAADPVNRCFILQSPHGRANEY